MAMTRTDRPMVEDPDTAGAGARPASWLGAPSHTRTFSFGTERVNGLVTEEHHIAFVVPRDRTECWRLTTTLERCLVVRLEGATVRVVGRTGSTPAGPDAEPGAILLGGEQIVDVLVRFDAGPGRFRLSGDPTGAGDGPPQVGLTVRYEVV